MLAEQTPSNYVNKSSPSVIFMKKAGDNCNPARKSVIWLGGADEGGPPELHVPILGEESAAGPSQQYYKSVLRNW